MSNRFVPPASGGSTPIRFPPAIRETLPNGLALRVIPTVTVPVATALLVLARGTGDDPTDRPGLASLTGDLLDEGAGNRDAIEVADAFVRLGAQVDIDVGPDVSQVSVTMLSRSLAPALELLADLVVRPRFAEPDFARVRELRLSRLRQLSRSSTTAADRAYVNAVFDGHPYGHGAMGTTTSLAGMRVDDARAFWSSMYGPSSASLVVGGSVKRDEVLAAAERAFGSWARSGVETPRLVQSPLTPSPRILLVDRPGAPQSELRIGHAGPARDTEAYHALVALNALLGGQFSSRINRRLREERGITYGARSAFDFRRVAGTFSCETSVQADATASAVADVLGEFDRIRSENDVTGDELSHAKASLTRGYVRHFETAGQLVRAAGELVTYGLDDDTFDRFVAGVDAVTLGEIGDAARRFIRPADATVVVVGDAASCRAPLEGLGREVVVVTPEF